MKKDENFFIFECNNVFTKEIKGAVSLEGVPPVLTIVSFPSIEGILITQFLLKTK